MTEIVADLSLCRGDRYHLQVISSRALSGFVWNARFKIDVCLGCLLCGDEVEKKRIFWVQCEYLLGDFVL